MSNTRRARMFARSGHTMAASIEFPAAPRGVTGDLAAAFGREPGGARRSTLEPPEPPERRGVRIVRDRAAVARKRGNPFGRGVTRAAGCTERFGAQELDELLLSFADQTSPAHSQQRLDHA